jgi:hypothetical protein
MAPIDDEAARRSSLGQGSGDLQLELTISKLRSAMLRAIDELDAFTQTVKLARTEVERLTAEQTEPGNNN